MLPENLVYTKDHEWIFMEDDTATIGITEYAQEELGDIVFAELPEAGNTVQSGDSPVTLESVKAVSSVYTPFDGEITGVNIRLTDEPELINNSPFDEGWIFKMNVADTANQELMSYEEYQDYIESLD